MLILRRYAGQTLCIGPNVEVRVIAIERREGAFQVVIGIEAPKEIRVDRFEVRQARNGITKKVEPR